jgi:hypothetical protein
MRRSMSTPEREGAMTAATTVRIENTLEVKTPMLAFLQGLHERWLQEVRGILEPARQDEAGLWIRWRAIQYLGAGFARRFERERRAVISLHGHLTGAQPSHLWAAGELLTQLLERLDDLVGLCHRAEEFSAVTLNLLSALEYWCQQVEEALGAVRWGKVSAESRHLFEVISEDDLVQGC